MMNIASLTAKQFNEVYFGGNWTAVNLKETLADTDWKLATTKVNSCNTIAAMVYHINYYVRAALNVLEGKPLDAKDEYSFNLPPVRSQEDWQALLVELYTDAEKFAALIRQLPDSRFSEIFAEEKYGHYYRNIHGIIEHTHYHLGQIVLIKKMLLESV